MLWLVLSLFLTSIFWPVMTPMTWGLYWQPLWSSRTGVEGTSHCLSGRPDFTHTNAHLSVLLSLTTASSVFAGVGCAFMQNGTADISMFFGVGAVPSNITLPVMVAPFSISGL